MAEETNKIKVLYIDDEENNLFSFKATLRTTFEIYTAISGEVGKAILKENPDISVIVTDQRMPEMTGVEFLESIIDDYPDSVRILLTGYADMGAVIDAVNKGKIYHYLSKPWVEEELTNTIINAYRVYEERINERILNEKLMRSNDQLEFLLRQKLLS